MIKVSQSASVTGVMQQICSIHTLFCNSKTSLFYFQEQDSYRFHLRVYMMLHPHPLAIAPWAEGLQSATLQSGIAAEPFGPPNPPWADGLQSATAGWLHFYL